MLFLFPRMETYRKGVVSKPILGGSGVGQGQSGIGHPD